MIVGEGVQHFVSSQLFRVQESFPDQVGKFLDGSLQNIAGETHTTRAGRATVVAESGTLGLAAPSRLHRAASIRNRQAQGKVERSTTRTR